jgi:hypothetical protein
MIMSMDNERAYTDGLESLDGAGTCSLASANLVDGVISNTGTIDLPLLPDFLVDQRSNAATELSREPKAAVPRPRRDRAVHERSTVP